MIERFYFSYIQEFKIKMKKSISIVTEDFIKSKFIDPSQLEGFIQASEEYKKLIEDGLVIKRGYNIMTTEEIFNPL